MKLEEKTNRRRDWIRRGAVALVAIALLIGLRGPLVAWFTGAPIGSSQSEARTTQAGEVELEVALRPDPPRQEGNTLLIKATDSAGEPLEDAEVAARYMMPAMGAMAEMSGKAEVKSMGAGKYEAAFDLPMGGTWTLDVKVRSAKASGTASYTMTVGNKGLTPVGGSGTAKAAEPVPEGERALELSPQRYPDAVLASLETALDAYEEARALLAADRVDGLPAPAERLAKSLEASRSGLSGGASEVTDCLAQGIEAARSLGKADDLEDAREAFSDVSRYVIALAAADPRLADERHVFTCPMAEGFDKWVQVSPDLNNPYMGKAMLACGSKVDWSKLPEAEMADAGGGGNAGHVHADGEIAHYTCSMHPSVKQSGPGTCPICAMNLTPVTREEVETGVIFVDAQRRQLIGVRTGQVERKAMKEEIRAVGKVAYDETSLEDVSLKYRGWIRDLKVNESGQKVKRGETLFTIYSPELYTAQEEFLAALASQKAAGNGGRADYLVRSARQRLHLWDLAGWQIDQIAKRGRPYEAMPIVSPATGYVIEKNVVEGGTVEPGMQLYRIAKLDRVWIEAEVYESELSLVKVGQEAVVTLPYIPGKRFTGTIKFVFPYLDGPTRTGRIRVELPNSEMELKPDMYANVEISLDGGGERLMVPESAVIYSGPRRLVFVDMGEGRLRPQKIEVGRKTGDFYEVLEGLEEGDTVVTSANFLIGAESRLKSAAGDWE